VDSPASVTRTFTTESGTDTVSEDELYRFEREAFLELVRHPDTLARIEHMLATGKPLRN